MNPRQSTLYLIEKKENIILPIKLANQKIKSGKTLQGAFGRFLACVDAKILGTTIYKYLDGTFYTYLNISYENNHIELNIDLVDAISMVRKINAGIYVHWDILYDQGIKVSARMIHDALEKY